MGGATGEEARRDEQCAQQQSSAAQPQARAPESERGSRTRTYQRKGILVGNRTR
jgi:hypothetical protein